MWVFGRTGESPVTTGINGTGLTAIVTGASCGLGLKTTRVLALRGVQVVMAVRNVDAGHVGRTTELDVMKLDLSSLASVRKLSSEYVSTGLPLLILIYNAGIMACPFSISEDNVELQFTINHLGHFLLTNLLLGTMKKTTHASNKEGRIVILRSLAHIFMYNGGIQFDKINDESEYFGMRAYGQSKLANILQAKELARRLKEDGVNITVYSLQPGSIVTNLVRHQCSERELLQAVFWSCTLKVLLDSDQGMALTEHYPLAVAEKRGQPTQAVKLEDLHQGPGV
ncbi:unnamed protein product, partial [Linum tenue]